MNLRVHLLAGKLHLDHRVEMLLQMAERLNARQTLVTLYVEGPPAPSTPAEVRALRRCLPQQVEVMVGEADDQFVVTPHSELEERVLCLTAEDPDWVTMGLDIPARRRVAVRQGAAEIAAVSDRAIERRRRQAAVLLAGYDEVLWWDPSRSAVEQSRRGLSSVLAQPASGEGLKGMPVDSAADDEKGSFR